MDCYLLMATYCLNVIKEHLGDELAQAHRHGISDETPELTEADRIAIG